MKRLCVFCGSSPGRREAYAETARAMARALVDRGLGLVYGGGSVGLMGILADAVLARGRRGDRRPAARASRARSTPTSGLTELHLVGSMHERKALMASLADGFVGLPGGLGTLEEVFEVLTWAQLGIHRKPVGLVDVDGYWAGLRAFVRHAATEGFVRPEYAGLLLVEPSPTALLDRFAAWQPSTESPAWLDPTET